MSWRTPNDWNRKSARSVDTLELPLILAAVLEEMRWSLPEFLTSLVREPYVRRMHREPYRREIEANLFWGQLKSLIWLGPKVRYYYPANAVAVFGATLPEKQMGATGVPLSAILWHPLLADERIVIREIEAFDPKKSVEGIRFLLDVPTTAYALYQG